MHVPLTVNDFLDRAETVYPDRIAVVDEPDQPAAPLGPWTYARLAAAARSQAAALDRLGGGGRCRRHELLRRPGSGTSCW
jgi:non-ribosomal peptide synthetase component E (peptide arylation enzyme)